MNKSEFYEATHQELIQEQIDLKITIKNLEEERYHLMEKIGLYTHGKGTTDSQGYVQKQLWTQPWDLITDMQKQLKAMANLNDAILTSLRIKASDLSVAIEEQYGEKKTEQCECPVEIKKIVDEALKGTVVTAKIDMDELANAISEQIIKSV